MMRPIDETKNRDTAVSAPHLRLLEIRRDMALLRHKMLKKRAATLFMPEAGKPNDRRKRR
jgi:hypothetical protein